jgi:hypothetical protein
MLEAHLLMQKQYHSSLEAVVLVAVVLQAAAS